MPSAFFSSLALQPPPAHLLAPVRPRRHRPRAPQDRAKVFCVTPCVSACVPVARVGSDTGIPARSARVVAGGAVEPASDFAPCVPSPRGVLTPPPSSRARRVARCSRRWTTARWCVCCRAARWNAGAFEKAVAIGSRTDEHHALDSGEQARLTTALPFVSESDSLADHVGRSQPCFGPRRCHEAWRPSAIPNFQKR